MVEIFFHFFTNNHMHRAFSFFRLISWKVSVSLFHCRLAEEWLPSAKLSFHLVGRYFFSARFSASFFAKFTHKHECQLQTCQMSSAAASSGSATEGTDGHERWKKENFVRKLLESFLYFSLEKRLGEDWTRWRMWKQLSDGAPSQPKFAFPTNTVSPPNECGRRFLSRRRFSRKAETVGCYQRVNSVIGWQCGLCQ